MGLNLLTLRKERGLSQGQIAKALGTSRQVFSRYERGESEMNYATLIALSKYFDVSIDYLLGNSSYYYPDNVGAYASSLPNDERELLELFRRISPYLQGKTLEMLRTWSGSDTTSSSAKKA